MLERLQMVIILRWFEFPIKRENGFVVVVVAACCVQNEEVAVKCF